MENRQQLYKEITSITESIKSHYPELYIFLDELPMTIPAHDNPEVNEEMLADYLNSLKQLLEHYVETHQTVT